MILSRAQDGDPDLRVFLGEHCVACAEHRDGKWLIFDGSPPSGTPRATLRTKERAIRALEKIVADQYPAHGYGFLPISGQ